MSVLPFSTALKATSQKRRSTAILIVAVALGGWLMITFFRRSLLLGYVDSAIVQLRAIVAQEANFAKAHPGLGYTCTLSELPPDGLIEPVKNGEKNGYAFEITGCGAEGGNKPNLSYQVTARPLHAHMPVFCSDQSGIVKSEESGSPATCLQSGALL